MAVYLEPFDFMAFPTRGPSGPNTKTRFLLPPDHYFSSSISGSGCSASTRGPTTRTPTIPATSSRASSAGAACELRRGHNTRGDAWTNYLEEVQLQVNYPFVNGPRSRELLYVFASCAPSASIRR